MANDIKKYVGPDSLSAILNNIESTYAQKDHGHPAASTSNNGFMTADDKNKLESIDTGAEVNVIESISINGEKVEIVDKAVNINTAAIQMITWEADD